MKLRARIGSRLRDSISGLPRPFWFLWTGTLVNRAGCFVMPFMALYLTQSLHLSLARAGAMIALYGAGSSVAGPLGGFLADHVGRRAVMIAALGLGGVGMIAMGMVRSVGVLAPVVFLVALVSDMYRPAMQAAVADMVAPQDRVRAFGLVYWVINVGFAVGLTVGGLLASRSFTWLFVGDGATTLVYAALVAFGVPESRPLAPPRVAGAPRARALKEFLAPYRDVHFVLFLGLSLLFALVFMQNATTLAMDMTAHGLSKAAYGRVLALNGIIIVFVQPFLAPLLARRNRSRTLAAGAALVGAGFGLNALARTLPVFALGVAIWTMGEMMVLPVASALVADLAPTHIRGRYQGAYSLSFGLAACTAPVLGMSVLERYGAVALWSGCLGLGLAVAAGHLALRRALTATRRARMDGAAANAG